MLAVTSVWECFREVEEKFTVLARPQNSFEFSPMKHLWDIEPLSSLYRNLNTEPSALKEITVTILVLSVQIMRKQQTHMQMFIA